MNVADRPTSKNVFRRGEIDAEFVTDAIRGHVLAQGNPPPVLCQLWLACRGAERPAPSAFMVVCHEDGTSSVSAFSGQSAYVARK